MRCHVCNVAVGDGQRFCHECGESLDGVTDSTGALDVIEAEAIGDGADTPAVGPDAASGDERSDRSALENDVEDDVTVETGGATGSGAVLESETVAPPAQPEPASAPKHRGALPDLAAPPFGDDDAAWWAAGGGAPEPTDDDLVADDVSGSELPWTEPIEVIAASPPLERRDDAADGLPATEAMAILPNSPTTPRNSLDSVPYAPMDAAPALDPPTYEATTTMPTVGDSGEGLGVTDEFAPSGPGGVGSTAEMAVTHSGGLFDGGSDGDELRPAADGFRLRASFVFAFLAMVATLMASVADVTDIRTTRPVDGIIVGIRALDDFGTNLAVAGFIGAALMLIGGLLSCFGLRWGAGLAGGAGLSMAGWAAVTLGLVEAPIHAAEGVTANANEVTAFTLSVTRDLGYFLILAIGLLGLVVFLVSLRMAGTGGRGGLNPWIAAVGALAAVVLAAGPLITLNGAPLDANLGTIGIPKEFFAGRLVQLGLLVVTGVVGFLSVRTYGLGLAAGGLGVATWLWITSLADIGDLPVSVAVGNIGTLETTPHAVTTVGVTASLALLLIAATVAMVTRRRV